MKKISRRQFLRVSAVAGAGAVLAACGGKEEPTEAPSEEPEVVATKPAPATATPKAEVIEPTAVPEAEQVWPREVTRERTLVYAFGAVELAGVGIGNMYANNWHQMAGSSMLEFPFYYSALNDKTYPWLAESWEYNDDYTEMTLYMRKGAMWADGEALDANDVVFTYSSLKAAAPDYANSSFVDQYVASVEAVDDYTVKFTLTEPNPRWHFTGCTGRFDRGIYLVPEHIFSTVEGDWREFMYFDLDKMWPVYSGPYSVTRFDMQVKHMDLRYEWWAVDVGLVDAMPEVERIVQFGWPGEEVGSQMLINDEVDVTLDLRPASIEAILAMGGDHITTHTFGEKPYGYMDWWPTSLFFNTLEAPYDNEDVRWAIAYAIDHQQVMDVGYGGAGVATNLPFPGYPGLTKFRDNAEPELKALIESVLVRDVAKVEELMTAAGFAKNADGFFAKGGEVFKPEILTVDIYGDIGPVVVEQLRQAGFDATMINPPDAWTIMGNGDAHAFFRGHGGSVKDPWTTMDFYTEKNSVPTGENVVGESWTRWWDPEYEEFVAEMARTSPDDAAKMQELYNKAAKIWYTALPEVPISEWFHRLAMNTTYWTGWPNKDDAYNTAPWHHCFVITLSRLKAVK